MTGQEAVCRRSWSRTGDKGWGAVMPATATWGGALNRSSRWGQPGPWPTTPSQSHVLCQVLSFSEPWGHHRKWACPQGWCGWQLCCAGHGGESREHRQSPQTWSSPRAPPDSALASAGPPDHSPPPASTAAPSALPAHAAPFSATTGRSPTRQSYLLSATCAESHL